MKAKSSPLWLTTFGSTHVVSHTRTRPTMVHKPEIQFILAITLLFPSVAIMTQQVLDEEDRDVQSYEH
jgi:hypothetical protein